MEKWSLKILASVLQKIELKPRINTHVLFRRCNARAVRVREKGKGDRERHEALQDDV